jgi:adenylate cyclase
MSASAMRMLIRLGISGAVFLLFLLHTSGLVQSALLRTLENVTYDSRILLTMPETKDPRIVVVDLDDRTLAAEGWPLPRDKWAEVVRNLFETYHVKVVGFDIVFSEPDRASGREMLERLAAGPLADLPGFAEKVPELTAQLDTDKAFADAIRGHPVILGYAFQSEGSGSRQNAGTICLPLFDKTEASQYAGVSLLDQSTYIGNLPVLQEATRHCGFFDLPTLDEDGVIRTVPLMQRFENQIYPSLALAVTRAALGDPAVQLEFEPPEARTSLNLERVRFAQVFAPVNESVSVMAPYRGRFGSFPYVSVTDVIHGKADTGVLKDAIVFIGTTATGLKDLRTTPVGQAYAGVEIHANIASAILDGRIKQKAPYYAGMETVILLVIGLLLAWAFPKLSPAGSAGITAVIIGALVIVAFMLWSSSNTVMPLGVPIVFTLVAFLSQLLYGYFVETRRSRDISKRFGEYVPPEIVEEMAANPQAVSMEGKSKEMTVLFSDVRAFTTISEQFKDKPQELSELMNHFLTPLTKVIQRHRGTIDKYMGDAIMAFWGAPLDDPKHAENALRASLELPKAIRELDEMFARRGWPPLQIGVGLSTGNMRVGNMGSEFRRAYTVMGDPVNLGARVEGLTKEYGATVICSEFTRNAGPSDWSYRELDTIRVKGKDQPVTIYEPMGPKEALSTDVRNELARHRGALKQFRGQQWDQAESEFFSLSRTPGAHKVYEIFLERIAYYRKNPPGEKWDGVFTFKTK